MPIVFTNGCFDVLHLGHLKLLEFANKHKGAEGSLIVGLNSDASVKRLKGESRPFHPENIRFSQMNILPWVDRVIMFDEDTPHRLIKELQPDCIVKGGDYTAENVIGSDLAEVILFSFINDLSTTKILCNKHL
jgi:rfaE bifunctional protein nucleotidyltransferase chain/domain